MENFNESCKKFEIIKKLGQGSFGRVYQVQNKIDNKYYVMKKIDLTALKPTQIDYINNEVKLMSMLDNEFIVKYCESFFEKNEQAEKICLNIIMEYCDGGDLSQLINSHKSKNKLIEEKIIFDVFKQICTGLNYLHRNKVLHRDLKCGNIFLFKDGRVKIGDLGVAKLLLAGSFAKTMVGTPLFFSPEICNEKPYNEKSDIWALGCILYELVTLHRPFNSETQIGLIQKIINAKYEKIENKIKSNYNKKYFELIDQLLSKNTKSRPSIEEIVALLTSIVYTNREIKPIATKNNPTKIIEKKINVKANSSKQEVSFRVRKDPKNKDDNQLSRQALAAKYKISKPNKVSNKNVNNELYMMNTIQQFDKKLSSSIENNDDNLSATAFFKKAMKTENYCEVFKNEDDNMNIPLIHDINNFNELEIAENEIQNEDLNIDITLMMESAKQLVGEEKFKRIYEFYQNLVVDSSELTDEHSKLMTDFINETLQSFEKDIYINFLEIFYKIVYLKYVENVIQLNN